MSRSHGPLAGQMRQEEGTREATRGGHSDDWSTILERLRHHRVGQHGQDAARGQRQQHPGQVRREPPSSA